jgi:signal transduction histidine kinase
MSGIFSKRNSALLLLIIAVAASLSIVSYNYSAHTSEQIEEIAVHDIRSNAEIQVHDLSNSLANKLADVTNNLNIIAKSPSVRQADFESARTMIDNAELASEDIVDFYMWLDKDGRIVWISNINQTTYEQYRGFDLSYRSYFIHPRDTLQAYYSSVTDSNDRILRLYISYPIIILDEGDSFAGVVVAGVRTSVLGEFLEGQISPQLQSQVGLLDNRGIILYSKDTPYTGKNVFGVRYQSFLSSLDPESVNSINSGFKAALHSETGSKDTAIGDTRVTFAYQPVILEGQQFGVLYIFAPHGQATAAAALIDQQENLTMLMIIGIAASASGIIFVIFLWNKRLQQTVDTRTAELRKANEQLKAHDRMQQEFINIAAHELRTPVQPILGMTEMLESEMPDKSDDIKMIARNARRLQRLTEDILDVAKIESKSLKLKKTTFEFGEVTINLLNDYGRHKIVNGDVRFQYEPKEEVAIEADKDRITQVVSNLLDNALKFTKKKGTITITTEKQQDGQLTVRVADEGPGIDPEIFPRLFTKFVSRSQKGTGLGLFISKSIVEAHGGKIWAENNSDGKGASFYFTLPLSSDQASKIEGEKTGKTLS